jgi:membrane protein
MEGPMDELRQLFQITVASVQRWLEDRCMSMAAAASFFAAFSLAPTVVIAIAVGGFFFGEEAVTGQLFNQLRSLIGEEGAIAVQALVKNAARANGIGIKTAISVATLLFGASVTFAQLNDNVNQIWRAPPPESKALWTFVRVRLLSMGLVIGVGFLLVVSLIVDALLQGLQEVVWGPDRSTLLAAVIVSRVSSFLLLGAVFGLLIKAMLRVHAPWTAMFIGGLVASGLFSIGRHFFGLYLATAGTADAFGAAGSLAVILMWLFYSAAVFMFGVVFARLWTEHKVEST